jgi:hypothetical protein
LERFRGKVELVLKERSQTALNYATECCKDDNQSINPRKTIVIPFTKEGMLNLVVPLDDGLNTVEFSIEKKIPGNCPCQ